MATDSLATPCGLYCGSCRYFIVKECRGCGREDKPQAVGYSGCPILTCCRRDKGLNFCSECKDFPCEQLKRSHTQHPEWLDKQAKLTLQEGNK